MRSALCESSGADACGKLRWHGSGSGSPFRAVNSKRECAFNNHGPGGRKGIVKQRAPASGARRPSPISVRAKLFMAMRTEDAIVGDSTARGATVLCN